MKPLAATAATLTLSLAMGSLASATQFPYALFNHPDGSAAPPAYGLRLDGLFTGDEDDTNTFDFEYTGGSSMQLVYDDVAETIHIFGTARLNGSADDYTVDFTYSANVLDASDGLGSGIVNEVSPEGQRILAPYPNSGTISGPGGSFDLIDEQGGHSYAFRLGTNHRGVAGLSGWGWMNHSGGANYPDAHLYDSDWLFTAQSVPDGGTSALLLGVALGGLALAKRKSTRP